MKQKLFKRTCNLTFLLVLLSIFSCQLIPCNNEFDLNQFENSPKFQDLVGEYYFDVDPRTSIAPGGLILKKDSTFILNGVTTGLLNIKETNYGDNKYLLDDINGNWRISHYKKDFILNIEIPERDKYDELKIINPTWNIYQREKRPIILIKLNNGDPCKNLQFIKKEENHHTAGNNV